jgi:hypothetical protein
LSAKSLFTSDRARHTSKLMIESLKIKATDETVNEFSSSSRSDNATAPPSRAIESAPPNLTPLVFADERQAKTLLVELNHSFLFFKDGKAFYLFRNRFQIFQWRELSVLEAQDFCRDNLSMLRHFIEYTNYFPVYQSLSDDDRALYDLKK